MTMTAGSGENERPVSTGALSLIERVESLPDMVVIQDDAVQMPTATRDPPDGSTSAPRKKQKTCRSPGLLERHRQLSEAEAEIEDNERMAALAAVSRCV